MIDYGDRRLRFINEKVKIQINISKISAICIDQSKFNLLLAGNNNIYHIKSNQILEAESREKKLDNYFGSRIVNVSGSPHKFAYSVSNNIYVDGFYMDKCLLALKSHTKPITCLDFRDPQMLVSGAADGCVYTWDFRVGNKFINELNFCVGSIYHLKICQERFPNLLGVGYESFVHLYDIRNTKNSLMTAECDGDYVTSLEFSPKTGEKLIAASNHRCCKIWNLNDLSEEEFFYKEPIWKVKCDLDEKFILAITRPSQATCSKCAQESSQHVNVCFFADMAIYENIFSMDFDFSDFFFAHYFEYSSSFLVTWNHGCIALYSLRQCYEKIDKSLKTHALGQNKQGNLCLPFSPSYFSICQYPWLSSLTKLGKDFVKTVTFLHISHNTGDYTLKITHGIYFLIFYLKYTLEDFNAYNLLITLGKFNSREREMESFFYGVAEECGKNVYKIVENISNKLLNKVDFLPEPIPNGPCGGGFYNFSDTLFKYYNSSDTGIVVIIRGFTQSTNKSKDMLLDSEMEKCERLAHLYTINSKSLEEFCIYNCRISKHLKPALSNLWNFMSLRCRFGFTVSMKNVLKRTVMHYHKIRDIQSVAMIAITLRYFNTSLLEIKKVDRFEEKLSRSQGIVLCSYHDLYQDMLIYWGFPPLDNDIYPILNLS